MRSQFLLVIAAAVWGSAFVAQKSAMQYMEPMAFNALRFFLGAFSLLPVIYYFDKRKSQESVQSYKDPFLLRVGIIAGVILFGGAAFQQAGVVHTTAGNAAFVTGLYVVLVPVLGIFSGQRSHKSIWLGALFALFGLYLICLPSGSWKVNNGDLLVFVSVLFWSVHVLYIDKVARKVDSLKLAFYQFIGCAILSSLASVIFEGFTISGVQQALGALLFAGLISVGVAYTLQLVAQCEVEPGQAAIIISFEAAFGALAGYIFLDEILSSRALVGCSLMIIGMILSQLPLLLKKRNPSSTADLFSVDRARPRTCYFIMMFF